MTTLEKIRTEIKTKYDSIPWRDNDYNDGWVEALEWVYDDVIGKYAEQEPTDKSNLEKICEELAAENDDLRDQLAMRDRFKQEPCDDAVSRQEVLDYLEANVDDFPDYHEAIEKVLELPSVRPQEQTGHWILKRTFPTKLYDEYLNEYKCSECYRKIRCTESQLVNYPYCHCGAKMESEDKE